MSVYVDDVELPYGRMKMCHMVADTLSELHIMAEEIGVGKKHFQYTASSPHYDICKSKKAIAIKQGAILVSSKQLVKIAIKLRNQLLIERVEYVFQQQIECPNCEYYYQGTTTAAGDDPSNCTNVNNLKECRGLED